VLLVPASALYLLLDPGESRFYPWLAVYALQFALYSGVALHLFRRRSLSLPLVLPCALASRVVLWFSEPVFEADYYRYLWDGHVLSQGINPYLHPPDAPALDDYETDYRFFIQWSQYRTIYPPVAQYVFALAHVLAPDSLLALKVLLTLFDLATGLVLIAFLRARGLDPGGSALYLLNPLVLKEVANSAHVDALPSFLALAAAYFLYVDRRGRAWLFLALAAGAKLYAVSLAPALARLDARYRTHALGAAMLFAVLYVPFLGAGTDLLGGGVAFARHWVFNASLYRVLSAVLPSPTAAKLAAGALFVLFVSWRVRRLRERDGIPAAALAILGTLLLLSPVVNAWYVLWLVPFACLERSLPWLAFSFLVGLSYSWFHSPTSAHYFQAVEYTFLGALLVHGFRRRLR
jgi:hypothetical protein